jgi:hypothetical protein
MMAEKGGGRKGASLTEMQLVIIAVLLATIGYKWLYGG